jgi:outer membrane cobalamin receptor
MPFRALIGGEMARRLAIGVMCLVLGSGTVFAQGSAASQAPAQQPPAQPQTPPADPAEEPPIYTEAVVVTASKVEQQIVNAPATVTVVSSDTIQSSPINNFAELLREVPGMNITQT